MLACYIVYSSHKLHRDYARVCAAKPTPSNVHCQDGFSACVSDAARSWLVIEEHFVGLSPEDISRLSVTPSGDVALLLTLCTKRVADGLKDPLFLALLCTSRTVLDMQTT
jgi:hypothetical protein